MKIHLLNRILVIGLMVLLVAPVQAVEEKDLIAILQSSAGAPAKCAACQQLRINGTAQSVATLAGLLGAERVGHAACYALEGMPYPEADDALRNALTKTSGSMKANLVDSLGWRRDEAAVPLLAPLLSDGDTTLAATAASALGRIASQDAVAALSTAREHANPTVRNAVLEALLCCADDRFTAGDVSDAAALYRDLFSAKVPLTIRSAAWRGWVLSDSDQRARLVLQALEGTDEPLQHAALKLVRELKDAHVVTTCLGQWDSLDAEAQLAVLDAHMAFGAEASKTVAKAGQSPYVTVRIAAWQALAELNDPAMISALAHAATLTEEAERDAARDTLRRIHGPGVREALLTHLKRADAAEKAELLLARRPSCSLPWGNGETTRSYRCCSNTPVPRTNPCDWPPWPRCIVWPYLRRFRLCSIYWPGHRRLPIGARR